MKTFKYMVPVYVEAHTEDQAAGMLFSVLGDAETTAKLQNRNLYAALFGLEGDEVEYDWEGE